MIEDDSQPRAARLATVKEMLPVFSQMLLMSANSHLVVRLWSAEERVAVRPSVPGLIRNLTTVSPSLPGGVSRALSVVPDKVPGPLTDSTVATAMTDARLTRWSWYWAPTGFRVVSGRHLNVKVDPGAIRPPNGFGVADSWITPSPSRVPNTFRQ
ncbi:hypothetical protein [Streptomyces eurythermus]